MKPTYLSEWLEAAARQLARVSPSGGTFSDRASAVRCAVQTCKSWRRSLYEKWQADVLAQHGSPPSTVWLIKANVVMERPWGPGGAVRRNGTRLYRGGAKVYVVRFWRNASPERVTIIGRHRGSHRFVSCVIETRFLTGFRLELVRSPTVIERYWLFPEQRFGYGASRESSLTALQALQSLAVRELR